MRKLLSVFLCCLLLTPLVACQESSSLAEATATPPAQTTAVTPTVASSFPSPSADEVMAEEPSPSTAEPLATPVPTPSPTPKATPTPASTPAPTPAPTPAATPTPTPTPEPTPTPVQSEVVFVGSVDSDKYHYPSCRYAKKIEAANEIWFSSAEEAQSMGYVACKVCHPPS